MDYLFEYHIDPWVGTGAFAFEALKPDDIVETFILTPVGTGAFAFEALKLVE